MLNEAVSQPVRLPEISQLTHKKILLIGIGGGGDILGCLPLANYLQERKNNVIMAGLSWKRKDYDPQAGPRRIDEFKNIRKYNSAVGWVNEKTRTIKGYKHIEADLIKLVEAPIITISINAGFRKTFQGVKQFVKKEKIDLVIGIDVGGDVLLKGDESTVRSPICDAIILAVLAHLPDTYLGVIGLGADGELPLSDFIKRFELIKKEQGFIGCRNFSNRWWINLKNIIDQAKTESSRALVSEIIKHPEKERELTALTINRNKAINQLDNFKITKIDLRSKTRIGELSILTCLFFFFKPKVVYRLNLYSWYIERFASVWSLRKEMNRRGLTTEIDEGN